MARDVDRFTNPLMHHAGPNTERYWANAEQLDADNIYLDAIDRHRGSAAVSGRRRGNARNRRADASGSRQRRERRAPSQGEVNNRQSSQQRGPILESPRRNETEE